ncbi:extensin family protein [Enterovirga aerilata]|uniref:Extensin family protein n=1 Tax=Enterovirga aerilata TaxID=2730920 RepID=A0A849IE25_9HYPH|nr:extensin family protein [Enterovirga sp. DB1703]NNM74475.1 extensin family protein [Enterovirga sp. DB1703]
MLTGIAPARAAPLPPDRPAEFGRGGATPPSPPSPPVPGRPAPPAPTVTPAPIPADPGCLDALRAGGGIAEPAPQPDGSDPACQVELPVRLSGVVPASGGEPVSLPDGPVLACGFARPLAEWISRVAAPLLGTARGRRLKAVRTGPGFQCRPRNRQAGEKPSAHGRGLAIDIAAFAFAEGPDLPVAPAGQSRTDAEALATIRQAACGWFTTILGPGSDPFHADHLHLDTQLHGSSDRYRICQ